MIVRSRRIGELAFSDGDKLRSAFNVGAITELIFFFKVKVTRFMARISRLALEEIKFG